MIDKRFLKYFQEDIVKTLERVGTGGGSESGGDKHLYPRTLLDLCEKLTGS